MSPRRPPPCPASRDGPRRGKRRSFVRSVGVPGPGKKQAAGNAGKHRAAPSRDYLRHSLPCCRRCTLLHTGAAFPKPPIRPPESARPPNPPFLPTSAPIFPQKTSALRKASCFSPPRVGTADAEQKDYRKSMFSLSRRENSRAPRASAPGVPMTHVFDVPHGNDARALFFPRQHAPRQNSLRSLKQRGAACRTLREKRRRRSLRSPEARRNIQRGESFLEQRGNFTARDFSEPCPARSVHPSGHRNVRAAEEPAMRRRASAGLPRFRAQKRRREARRLFHKHVAAGD